MTVLTRWNPNIENSSKLDEQNLNFKDYGRLHRYPLLSGIAEFYAKWGEVCGKYAGAYIISKLSQLFCKDLLISLQKVENVACLFLTWAAICGRNVMKWQQKEKKSIGQRKHNEWMNKATLSHLPINITVRPWKSVSQSLT